MVEEYYQFFKETLYPFTFTDKQLGIIQFGSFLENNSQFLLTPIVEYLNPDELDNKTELGGLSEEYGVPILIPSFETLILYLEWIFNRKYSIRVIKGPFLPYLFVDTDIKMTHSKLFNKYLMIDFENDERSVFANVGEANLLFKCLLNKNNPFITFISQNSNLIRESIKLLIEELFSMIIDSNYLKVVHSHIQGKYSEIVSRINSSYNKNFMPLYK